MSLPPSIETGIFIGNAQKSAENYLPDEFLQYIKAAHNDMFNNYNQHSHNMEQALEQVKNLGINRESIVLSSSDSEQLSATQFRSSENNKNKGFEIV